MPVDAPPCRIWQSHTQTPPETTVDNLSLEAQIAQHTEAISEHQRQIAQLRTRLNARALINARLSQEMLAEIFLQYVLMCDADERRLRGRSSMYQWTVVTLVCRYWREVATSFPRIWSFIDIYDISLTGIKELLVRSQNSPLQVYAILGKARWESPWELLNMVLQTLPRIRSLTISLPDSVNNIYVSQAMWRDSPAPLLESIIHIPFRNSRPSSNPSILHSLLRRDLPRLKRLELLDSTSTWTSLEVPPSLTTLIIRVDDECFSPPTYPMVDALAVLENLPLLKHLELHESRFIDSADTGSPEEHTLPTVSLLGLKHLQLFSTTRRCDLYMRHLTFPSHTKLDVCHIPSEVYDHHPGRFPDSAMLNSIQSFLMSILEEDPGE